MKPRLSSDPRTESIPAAAIAAWGFGPEAKAPTLRSTHPGLARLISLGLGALSLWLLSLVAAPALKCLFPGPSDVLRAETARATNPTPAPRAALLEDPPPPAPRALPVYHPGDSFKVRLPDGRELAATERGGVPTFSSLPLKPALGDHYTVTEGGAREGVSWIWYTPLGWNHPAWIDP
jgi:hypothetical protein